MSPLCRFAGLTACLCLCAHLAAAQSASVSLRAAASAQAVSAPSSSLPQAATGPTTGAFFPSSSSFIPPPGRPAPPRPSLLGRVLEVLSAEETALRFMAAPPSERHPSELQMLYEAREHVRRATTMELGGGVRLRLDPLKLRCRLKMRL